MGTFPHTAHQSDREWKLALLGDGKIQSVIRCIVTGDVCITPPAFADVILNVGSPTRFINNVNGLFSFEKHTRNGLHECSKEVFERVEFA